MAILWSLCRNTTTFCRDVRTMAIILRLLHVCSSRLLVRMLALPCHARHIVLSLSLPRASWRDPSWRDPLTRAQKGERGGRIKSRSAPACLAFQHTQARATDDMRALRQRTPTKTHRPLLDDSRWTRKEWRGKRGGEGTQENWQKAKRKVSDRGEDWHELFRARSGEMRRTFECQRERIGEGRVKRGNTVKE